MPRKWMLVGAIFVVVFMPISVLAESIYVKDEVGKLSQPALPNKTVLLTFDDGPSVYTSQILDILKQRNVRATFFVIGNQITTHPLLNRIYQEGHDIGNHTYTHPDLSKIPAWRAKFELNLTRIIISSQTHHSTRLFRPPYLGSDALTPSAGVAINRAAELGYISVGETIDSRDWQKPGIEQIVLSSSRETSGIILLHDGGGDRSQTVKALPAILDYYQAHGFRFMTVGEALGVPRQSIMPSLSSGDLALTAVAKVIFYCIAFLDTFLRWFIFILIFAGFARFILVSTAAIIQSRRKYRHPESKGPAVTVLVPAYNESAVIQSCLRSILASRYDLFEVLVIDDGSIDDTYQKALEIKNFRLKVLRKRNGGKASALNFGIAHARGHFLIAIDADTVFRTDTIAKLMRHFDNPKVGAVSGNTKIVNRHKLITKLQSLEYIVGFNLDRRMGDLLDCITVVPGAIGAFRRSAVQKAGGFSFDTLAEDTDITLAIKAMGYKIVYDSEAIALTEAPSTIRALLNQRFRWTFGTMQSVWKHKRAFFNPNKGSLGTIGLPYLFFFQIFFPLFSPLFDLALIIGLLDHRYKLMAISFVVYTLADLMASMIALRLDKEKISNLWLIVPQRIFYRQLMYYVIVRSFVNVLKGRLIHWGDSKREGVHLAKNL